MRKKLSKQTERQVVDMLVALLEEPDNWERVRSGYELKMELLVYPRSGMSAMELKLSAAYRLSHGLSLNLWLMPIVASVREPKIRLRVCSMVRLARAMRKTAQIEAQRLIEKADKQLLWNLQGAVEATQEPKPPEHKDQMAQPLMIDPRNFWPKA